MTPDTVSVTTKTKETTVTVVDTKSKPKVSAKGSIEVKPSIAVAKVEAPVV